MTPTTPAEFLQLVGQMRTAQKAYWHFKGEAPMKRRLLEFALEKEAEVDQVVRRLLQPVPENNAWLATPAPFKEPPEGTWGGENKSMSNQPPE